MELQHLAEVSRNEAIVFGHRLTRAEAGALEDFDICLGLAWANVTNVPLPDTVVQEISRLTFVYAIDPSGADRAALAAALAPATASPSNGASVLHLLERISGDLMSTRGGIDLPHLRRDLLGRGAALTARPDFRGDIAALRAHTEQVERNLRDYEIIKVETGQPIGIERHLQVAVNAAAPGGHLLLIGEPGAGKSAVLNALGRALKELGHDVVELAADRFSIELLEGLSSSALRLRHNLVDVLHAWDGPNSGFLLIDALDAESRWPCRGGLQTVDRSNLRG